MDHKCGYYYVKVIMGGQTYKFSTRTKDPVLADQIYQTFLKNLFEQHFKSKNLIQEKPQKEENPNDLYHTWNEYIETCRHKNHSKPTITAKIFIMNICKELKIRKFEDFSQATVNRILERLKNYSEDTKKKHVCEIKAFLNYAVKKGYINSPDIQKLDFPVYKTKVRDTVFNETDMKIIFDHLLINDIDFYFYCKFLYYTGSRPNEIPNLTWDKIDFQNNIINIFQNKTKKLKIIPILEELKPELIRFRQPEGYLFSGNGKDDEHYPKKFKRLKMKLKLNPKYTLYTFRHTCGTNIYKKTKDSKLGAMILGDTEEMYRKHYVNIDHQYYSDAVNGLKI